MKPLLQRTAFLFLATLFVGCGTKPAPEANPEPSPPAAVEQPAAAKGLEGSYLVIGVEMWGKKSNESDTDKQRKESKLDDTVIITKDRIQVKFIRREVLRYTLDSSKSPKEIDIFPEVEDEKKTKASYGIYKVEGDVLTLFLRGAKEPRLRPREFKTLDQPKEKGKDPEQVGGVLILTLKRVGDDTTFITDPPPKPKPPAVDDGPLAEELTKKGFGVEKIPFGKFAGVAVTVPSTLPADAVKELNGQPRIRTMIFTKKLLGEPAHPVTDEAIQGLTKLDGLTTLVFEYCPKITGAAFRDLGRFPLLTHVKIDSPVDDAATEEIAKSKTLERLQLNGMKLTDKALENVAWIQSLKSFWLNDAPSITAAGIKKLNALPNLEFLAMQGNVPAADAALADLRLPKLEILNFAQGDISDEGLGRMPEQTKLRDFTLSGKKFTDAGLKHLMKQPSLTSVTLFGTNATQAAADELKKSKPKMTSIGVIK